MTNIAFVNPLTLPLNLIEGLFTKDLPGLNNMAQEGISLPMGIMYLSAHIKKHLPSVGVQLIDYRIQFPTLAEYPDLDSFIKDIACKSIVSNPDIIAFSIVVSSSHLFFLRCLPILKRIWPNATFIVGGFHPTNFTRELLDLPEVEFVFRGEAENALVEFLRTFPNPGTSIAGVISKTDLGQDPLSMCRPLESMDMNPMPDYELVHMMAYVQQNTRMVIKRPEDGETRSANIMTSLGCPFHCTFCASWTVHGKKIRFKSIENVLKEVRYLYDRHGVTLIMPEDDLFTANKERTLELLEALRRLNIPNFRMQFPVALSVNTLSIEVLDALVAAGMDVASLAIESGSSHTQKHIIKKSVDFEKARNWISYLRKKQVPIRCSFILGFPGETRELMEESIDFASALGADWYDFFIATPLAGSEMCQEFIDLGHISNDIEIISRGYYSQRSFDTPEITAVDVADFVYRANLICNFANNVNLRLERWGEGIKLFAPIAKKYPFHIIAHDCLRRCHEALNQQAGAEAQLQKISEAIRSDHRAQEMFEKYVDLLSSHTVSYLNNLGLRSRLSFE